MVEEDSPVVTISSNLFLESILAQQNETFRIKTRGDCKIID